MSSSQTIWLIICSKGAISGFCWLGRNSIYLRMVPFIFDLAIFDVSGSRHTVELYFMVPERNRFFFWGIIWSWLFRFWGALFCSYPRKRLNSCLSVRFSFSHNRMSIFNRSNSFPWTKYFSYKFSWSSLLILSYNFPMSEICHCGLSEMV